MRGECCCQVELQKGVSPARFYNCDVERLRSDIAGPHSLTLPIIAGTVAVVCHQLIGARSQLRDVLGAEQFERIHGCSVRLDNHARGKSEARYGRPLQLGFASAGIA